MVVAVATVWVMQVAVHQVIDMITMRHRLMAAARPVDMICRMAVALMTWRAALWIVRIHRQAVLVNMITVLMVQVTIMQVINVTIVLDRRVTATGLVFMVVVGMLRASTHAPSPSSTVW